MAIRKPTKSSKPSQDKTRVSRRALRPEPTGTFWDRLAEIGRSVPEEEQRRLPDDLAEYSDEYLEGRRKFP